MILIYLQFDQWCKNNCQTLPAPVLSHDGDKRSSSCEQILASYKKQILDLKKSSRISVVWICIYLGACWAISHSSRALGSLLSILLCISCLTYFTPSSLLPVGVGLSFLLQPGLLSEFKVSQLSFLPIFTPVSLAAHNLVWNFSLRPHRMWLHSKGFKKL